MRDIQLIDPYPSEQVLDVTLGKRFHAGDAFSVSVGETSGDTLVAEGWGGRARSDMGYRKRRPRLTVQTGCQDLGLESQMTCRTSKNAL
jgi:hypothetical protein